MWTILNLMSYLKIYLPIAEMSGTWLTQYWSLDNLKIKQDLPCGVVVCFPSSNFHIVGIEPGISRRGQPSKWNTLEKHSSAKWTVTHHKLSARVEVHAVSVHVSQPLISLTFYCRTKMSRNTCIHIWSIAVSVCYTAIGHDSIRIER